MLNHVGWMLRWNRLEKHAMSKGSCYNTLGIFHRELEGILLDSVSCLLDKTQKEMELKSVKEVVREFAEGGHLNWVIDEAARWLHTETGVAD